MIAFHAEGNLILQQAFKTKSDRHRIAAYNLIMMRLAARCENIHSWISLVGDVAFSHKVEFMVLNSSERFFGDLFQRSHSLFSLFSTLFSILI
jgi:hypothetical protein